MPNAAASHLLLGPHTEAEIARCASSLLERVGGRVHLGFVFVSPDFRANLGDFLEVVQLHGHVENLLGCSTTGVIGTAIEAEGESGCSLLFLNLPETKISVSPIRPGLRPEEAMPPDSPHGAPISWIVLADPAAPGIEPWIARWGQAFPGSPIVGALASGGEEGAGPFLFHQRAPVEAEGIVIGLADGARVLPVVSHACRPIGTPLTITGAQDHLVRSLGNLNAYEVLSATYNALPDADKAISRGNLFAGLAASEYREDFSQGDFLIRNILGADPNSGAVAIAGTPRVGQTLQFQLRDPRAAQLDLRQRCAALRERRVHPFASLLFSCIGRGEAFFGTKGVDAAALVEGFGSHPSAGAFCSGEIGPANSGCFIHGYTASAALFCDLYEGVVPKP